MYFGIWNSQWGLITLTFWKVFLLWVCLVSMNVFQSFFKYHVHIHMVVCVFTVIVCSVSRLFPYKALGKSGPVYLTFWKWTERNWYLCGGVRRNSWTLETLLSSGKWTSFFECDLWWLLWESPQRKNGAGNHQSLWLNITRVCQRLPWCSTVLSPTKKNNCFHQQVPQIIMWTKAQPLTWLSLLFLFLFLHFGMHFVTLSTQKISKFTNYMFMFTLTTHQMVGLYVTNR